MSRWPLRKAYFWEEAPLLRPLLALCAGIVCYDYEWLPRACLTQVLILLTVSGAFMIGAAFKRQSSKVWSSLYVATFALFFASLGWCAYATTDARISPGYFGRHTGTSVLHMARVEEVPQARASTTKYALRLLNLIDSNGTKSRITGKALLYVYHHPEEGQIGAGDTLLVPAKWLPVRNSGNPFERDNAGFQRRQGICFQQFASPDEVSLFGKASPGNIGYLARIHNWCDRQLRAYIRDTASLGLLQAMLLGDENGFDPELRQAYAQTGVIHIVSISGSHVAVLFLIVTWALFWIRGYKGAVIRYVAGVLLVWLYVLIAGAPPPALRSALMFTIIALGVLSGREGQSLNTLLGAAFALLIAEPTWLFSVGFQLSFGAVLSILLFYKPIYSLWPQRTKVGRTIVQAIAASLAAEVLTAPLVIYYFHNFPLLFIIANLLSALLVGFCALVGGMAVIALCWWPAVARMIGIAVSFLVMIFNRVIVAMQSRNPESFGYLQISFAELLIIYVLIAALAVWWLNANRRGFLIALPTACLLLLMLTIDKGTALRQERLIVYSNSGSPLVERIRGQRMTTLAGDPDAYNAKAAHTGFHAWRRDMEHHAPYFPIGGKTVFILRDSGVIRLVAGIPADVLVIARPLRGLQVQEALDAFHPKEVVLAQRPTRQGLQRWQDSCRARGVRLYNAVNDGAWMLQ